VDQLADNIEEMRPLLAQRATEHTSLREEYLLLKGRCEAIEGELGRLKTDLTTQSNRIKAAFSRIDEMKTNYTIEKWRLIAYLAIAGGGGGGIVGAIMKLME
jgi:chromosome segregation ATPase